jgi:tRNA dimethylallyltransferase
MLSEEGIEEVRSLLERNLDPALPVMRAIGVAEIAAFIRGEITREQALEAGRTATRQYAKRQYTWFSRQPPPDWPRFTARLDCSGLADALARLDPRGDA